MTEGREDGRWAVGIRRFAVDPTAPAAATHTLAGRRLTGPQQGFGRLWRRTYTAVVDHPMPPADVLAAWRARFGDFWPKGNTFHGSAIGIEPGAVAPITVDTRTGIQLSTGVLVLYSDDESFTFMTPEGHMFAGWITFSAGPAPGTEVDLADTSDQEVAEVSGAGESAGRLTGTTLRIEVLLRPSDPLYHLAWPIMRRMESAAWAATLRNVAREVCGREVDVFERSEVLDRGLQWSNWGNVRYNAGIRSAWWTTGGRVLTTLQSRRAGGDR